ncbi:MAG TPA: D-2-hydroxyacid dehydrogenase [Tepidisphaeraceae bacterium]|nr:D-2-hydroxyacid dehydrogenase [Tepidisphaeraceae bacterium]
MDRLNLVIWCNAQFPASAIEQLKQSVGSHRLILSEQRQGNLSAGSADPLLTEADLALGQPDPKQAMELDRLRWIHLTSAGYTRYDTPPFRQALQRRGTVVTNSSMVYDEPCAEHVLAMMLAAARRLPQCWADQAGPRVWHSAEHRIGSRLLEGQTALLLGFGAIARRLVELLHPFRMNLIGVRRTVAGDEPIRTLPYTQLKELIPQADHVVNLLPANASTERLIDADLIRAMTPTAIFYNIGRGATVDQIALQAALETGRIAGAYLDVTDPEPLPPDHPLWRIPNCWITPHTAGGHATEFERLVDHFIDNLGHFEREEPLLDRVI